MIGQGSPFLGRLLQSVQVWPGWLRRSVLTMALLCCADFSAAAEQTVRLRVAWGGGAERQWHGTMRVTGGTVSELQSLGIEADEPGTIWIDPDQTGGTIIVRERTPRAYDGLDVLVTAEPDATLSIELEAIDEPPAKPDDQRPAAVPTRSVEVPLSQLIGTSHKTQLDATGNRLLVMRSPGDRLRVQFDRDNLVFSPREVFSLTIEPHLLGLAPGTPIRVKAQLLPAYVVATGKDKLWTKEFDAVTPEEGQPIETKPLEVKLPEAEGVYDLVIAAIQPGLAERLPWKKPLVERKVQLVVVDAERSPVEAAPPAAMTRVLEIDPANPRWYERLTHLPLLPGQRGGPIGSGAATRWEHATLGPMIQLDKGYRPQEPGGEEEPEWESYPLPLTQLGAPHILEVEYPSDVPQTLGISLVEPNAAGAVMPIGLDSGVYVTPEQADETPRLLKHRLVFWPRTKSPLLLVTNLGKKTVGVYGKIRVLSIPQPQLAAFGIGQKSPHVALPRAVDASHFLSRTNSAATAKDAPRGRLLCAYLDRPLFVENFAAPEAMDLFSRRSLDDWGTFYLGAERLVEYLNHVGHNGLVMSVLADGSTIYPSTRLEPTPKHDTGVFFANGQDALRKDVLELLFRMFDREGMTLIPALQFAAPLAELESLRRDSPAEATGIDLIGADGRPYAERHLPNQGLAPYYNPLHPRVQEAMIAVVQELADRYRQHTAYGGVALQLSAESYAQLPGLEWGFDDDTMERFAKDARLGAADRKPLLSGGEGRFAMRAELLAGKLREPWIDWRADQITSFHGRMKEACGGELKLLGASLFDNPVAQRNLHPALPRRTKIDDTLLAFGLRGQDYRPASGVALLRPYRLGAPTTLGSRAIDVELNVSTDVDQLFAGTLGGSEAMLYHEPVRTRLASFDEQSPFGKSNTYTWLVSQLSPSAERNRQRFVHAIATQDAETILDGGWLLPLGQEESLVELVSTYRQLPAEPFVALAEPSEPVTIRTLNRDGETYIYFANDSPWKVRTEILVSAPASTHVERLGPARKLPPMLRDAGGAVRWTIELAPFELVAARFAAPNVKFTRPKIKLDEEVQGALAKRINDLSTRVASLANPAPLPVLVNPGFEAVPGNAQIPGWTLGTPARTTGELVTDVRKGGKQSLRLESQGPRASIRSAVLDPPATGRLSIALWLKIANKDQQPIVRLAVEGRNVDADYFRFATVGGNGPNQVALVQEWSQYIYQVDDLPTAGMKDLRVRFELMSAGEVWIDDVQIYDLAFGQNERVELSKLISLADYRRGAGQYAGCLQLLDSYWPQFLVEHVPLAQGPGPLARRPIPQRKQVRPEPPPAEAPKTPGMLNRLKGFVPKFSGE